MTGDGLGVIPKPAGGAPSSAPSPPPPPLPSPPSPQQPSGPSAMATPVRSRKCAW